MANMDIFTVFNSETGLALTYVPEPSSTLLGSLFGALALLRRKRRN